MPERLTTIYSFQMRGTCEPLAHWPYVRLMTWCRMQGSTHTDRVIFSFADSPLAAICGCNPGYVHGRMHRQTPVSVMPLTVGKQPYFLCFVRFPDTVLASTPSRFVCYGFDVDVGRICTRRCYFESVLVDF